MVIILKLALLVSEIFTFFKVSQKLEELQGSFDKRRSSLSLNNPTLTETLRNIYYNLAYSKAFRHFAPHFITLQNFLQLS